MKKMFWAKFMTVVPLAVCHCSVASAALILGSAQNYAVLSGSKITNTGPTEIFGDIGISPGSSITDAGAITLVGSSTTHNSDAAAQAAQTDQTNTYNTLAGLPFTSDLTGQDLGGLVLTPGVYHFDSSAGLTGKLTLDAQNASNALFVFQIGSTLTTADSSKVDVINAGPGAGVYFQVGSSATLGTSTTFAGNILALDSITLNTSATILCGRALAQTGAVTMDTNVVSNRCSTFDDGSGRSDFGSFGFSGGSQAVPEPGPYALMSVGLVALLVLRRGASRARSRNC